MTFLGSYASGKSPSTAKKYSIAGAVPPSTYSTKISKSPLYDTETKQCKSSPSDFDEGPTVTIGYKFVPGEDIPKQIFKVNGEDLKDELRIEQDPETYLNVYHIDEDEITDILADMDPYFPVSAEFVMAADAKSFSGRIELLRKGEKIKNFCWEGLSQTQEEASHSLKSVFGPRATAELPPHVEFTSSQPLSTLELFTLCHAPPEVQSDAEKMMQTMMQYVINKDWSEDFLGVDRNALESFLSPAQKQLANLPTAKQFYTNFAMPYIGLGLYQQKGEGIPDISKHEGRKMLWYFRNGLADEKGFTEQTNGLYLQAFLVNKPRLKDYIDDQKRRAENGEDDSYWAKELHAAVLERDNINNLVTAMIHQQGDVFQQLKDYATVLNLLQPSGELACDAYSGLLAAIFGQTANEMDPSDYEDKLFPWIRDFIQEMVNKYDQGEPPSIDDAEALEGWKTAQAYKAAAEIFGSLERFAAAVTNLLVQMKGSYISSKANEVADNLLKKFGNKLSEEQKISLKRGVIAAVHIGAIFMTVQAFMHWNEIPPEQKAALIAETVELGIKILIELPKIIDSIVDIVRAMKNFLYKADILKRLGSSFGRMASKAGEWIADIAKSLKQFIPKGAKDFVIEGEHFLKGLFKSLPKVLSYLAPIVSLVVLITNIMTLINDPNAPMHDKILLILQIAAGLLETTCLIIGLFVAEFLSFAGPLAIIGVVLALIQFLLDIFLPREPEPSPAEIFYRDHLKPFLQTIAEPPEDYNPEGKVPPPDYTPHED